MSEEMKNGMMLAYQSIKEEMDTILTELHARGLMNQKDTLF